MSPRFHGTERTVSLARAFLREAAHSRDASTSQPVEPRLIGRTGVAAGLRHVLAMSDASALLGRDPACDIVLVDADVSRKHTRIERRGEQVTITDLGTKNGTRVNGLAIAPDQPQRLQHGALIDIGGCRFEFEDPVQHYLDHFDPDVLLDQQAAGAPILEAPVSLRLGLSTWLPRLIAAAVAASAALGVLML